MDIALPQGSAAPREPADASRVRVPTPEARSRPAVVPPTTSAEHVTSIETVREADRAPLRLAPAEVIPRARSEVANRVLNVALASIALFLLSPLLILVAAAIKLTSRGPIFYLQTRVGLDRRWNRTHAMYDRRTQNLGGSVFTIYKFRSMYVNAEHDGRAVWAAKQDARVTPVGRVLRQFRLDEIPQLINVLKGDMNIVGPRPERPSIFVRLRSDIADYPLRQRAKPGITGWAQINQSYDSCMDDVRRKVGFDLEYIQRQSLLEDVKIMLRTVPVILFKRGGW
jgi:lipopolysaccharide/colanic/teichoic acid biosynthesis glycosyltransferase